ncbi:MAG: Rrf2 family transcriptional regulator [Thermoguttaceae bacterium]|nr:Rrf2 family transcriptional regulator [Thermoguttaceae bacterium]
MISTKGRYALRVMIDMAEQKTNDYVPLNEIADRQGISIKYLEIILKSLVKAGLLEGRRGKGGGYKLTRAPEEYTVGEVLELTENSLASVACLMKDAKKCDRQATCRTYGMWKEFTDLVSDFFNKKTLADLVLKETEPVLHQIAPLKEKTDKKTNKA